MIHLIAFTKKGNVLAEEISEYLKDTGRSFVSYQGAGDHKKSLDEFAREGFEGAEALIYIGATGIAVRSIAPYVQHKTTDPAVLVIDDKGQFVIPLLSGHIGGANEFAIELARQIQATPVVTTATDNHGVFAIDTWAKAQGLTICNPERIKCISSKLLDGERIVIQSDFEIVGEVPQNVTLQYNTDSVEALEIQARIFCKRDAFATGLQTLQLVPPIYTVGIGCRKDTDSRKLQAYVEEVLAVQNLAIESVKQIASIDVKKEEQAICELAQKWKIPFLTYTAEELNAVEGEFESSEFVKQTVGTDNVCQRSAMAAAGEEGMVVLKKQSKEGMTISIIGEPCKLEF